MSSPDTTTLRVFLARVQTRVAVRCAMQGAAAGFAFVGVLELAVFRSHVINIALRVGIALVCVVIGALARLAFVVRTRQEIARMIERAVPHCRNVLVTAEELLDASDRVKPNVSALVQQHAARIVNLLTLSELLPMRPSLIAFGTAIVLWLTAVLLPSSVQEFPAAVRRSAVVTPSVRTVRVVITPPAYSALPPVSTRDPMRIDALAGSTIALTVSADADRVTVETVRGMQTLVRGGLREYTGNLVVDVDGFIAIEPTLAGDARGVKRLIGVSVAPDRAPHVRVSAPGHDMRFPDANRTLALSVNADDDLGLASLRMRYTKVSGSGERFTFTDGEIPLDVARRDSRTWTARGTLALGALGLSPGDMVVYRAIAADRRPGATPIESDSYIAEITAPGAVAASGFAIDNDQDRYALSEQMVILKTQRLLARRATISAEAFAADAADIATEQRRVRAEFVFMMGGEMAEEIASDASMAELDETQEAESEGDLAAGRMANRGRIALLRAIRSMSRASTALTTADATNALGYEKDALMQIERAFSRTRIILRALTARERLDMTRRLTGVLTTVTRDVRQQRAPEPSARVVALRSALAGIAGIANAATLAFDAAARASALAQRVLQIDASSKPLQEVATRLTEASNEISRGRATSANALLDSAAVGLGAVLRRDVFSAPSAPRSLQLHALDGQLVEARKRPPE